MSAIQLLLPRITARQRVLWAVSIQLLALHTSALRAIAQTIRDSAGIRIVMNTKPTWTAAQQLKLSATPTLVIGDREELPYQFTRVRNPIYLSDGRIVLCEKAANELRIYDGTGKYLKTFGHKGDGPGEFRDISAIARLAGDTIAVLHDGGLVSRFTSSGVYLSRSDDRGTRGGSTRPTSMKDVIMALNGGARVTVEWPFEQPMGTLGSRFDAKGTVEVVRGDGSSTKKPGSLALMQATSGKNGMDKAWLAAEALYTTDGAQFVIGYGTQYSLTRYAASGVPNLIVRRAWTATPVTSKDWEDWADEWLKRWSKNKGAELATERKKLLNDDYMDVLPAFSALVLDRTGRLWVRAPKTIDGAVAGSLNDFPLGPSTWSVFGPTGIWLGDVTMPSKFTPTDIGADYVLGIARDQDDTPTVARYKLSAK